MSIILHGMKYSVYTRIAKLALFEKGVDFEQEEVNPFADDMPLDYLDLHPFRRVPTLVHNDLVLYETTAITRYIDDAFDGPSLQPTDPVKRARMNQIVSIVDNYCYVPLVRQVFTHSFFWPLFEIKTDPEQVTFGLERSKKALEALEKIAEEGHQLDGKTLTLADLHLAPMMAYFVRAEEGREMLEKYQHLANWWGALKGRDSVLKTEPPIP